MIVSGGKLLAIDEVNVDGVTLSGDGVFQPLGLTSGVKGEIDKIPSKLDTNTFETWKQYATDTWDHEQYSAGSGISVQNHVISVSANYLTNSDRQMFCYVGQASNPKCNMIGVTEDLSNQNIMFMMAYDPATPHGAYPVGLLMPEPYYDSRYEKQMLLADSSGRIDWDDASKIGIEYSAGTNIGIQNHVISVTGLDQYATKSEIPSVSGKYGIGVSKTGTRYDVEFSGASTSGYITGSGTAADPIALDETKILDVDEIWSLEAESPIYIDDVSGVSTIKIETSALDAWSSVSAQYYKKTEIPMTLATYSAYVTDELGKPIEDVEGNSILDQSGSVDLYDSYDGIKFAAQRAFEDQYGNNISDTYMTKSEYRIDFAIDSASKNPVANSAIYAAIGDIETILASL